MYATRTRFLATCSYFYRRTLDGIQIADNRLTVTIKTWYIEKQSI